VGKYDPLRDYLAGQLVDEVKMSFADIEELVGPLPASARIHRAWWANDSKSEALAWQAAGWRVQFVDQAAERVIFARSSTSRPQPAGQTAAHQHTENPTQKAPGPAVTLPPPNAGLPEATMQSFVVSYLVSQGWQIQRVADTASREPSREQGIDILAARDGRILAVEVKGFPGTAYADPRRPGETKTATPAAQARVWFAQAILKAMLTRSDHPDYELAIALPDAPAYRSLHQRTRTSLGHLGIIVMFVTTEGHVH
jgi:Holliday junction resolvase-like predicted endonuclease